MSINEFILISPRGDTLVSKVYRGAFGSAHNTTDIFMRRTQDKDKIPPPIFREDDLTFAHIKTNNMYFVFTTQDNLSPCLLIELLSRLSRVFKDYCGVLTEESIRKNFLLLYELLDEVFDHGYPQGMSTELLKAYVYNEPQSATPDSVVTAGKGFLQGALGDRKTLPGSQANKPINVGDKKDNVIFVDVIEKLNVTLDKNCKVLHSSIYGSLVLKSFLTGSPEMRLGLNDDLVVRSLGIRGHGQGGMGAALALEDANFHECVRWNEEMADPVFNFFAPDGEFTLMSYRINSIIRPPIVAVPIVEESGANGLDFVVRLRGEFAPDKSANNVTVTFVCPPFATSVSLETAVGLGVAGSAGKADYDRNKRAVKWIIPKFNGNGEYLMRAKLMLAPGIKAGEVDMKVFGALNLTFDLPMHLTSNINIRFLDFIYNAGSQAPHKWIRYLTNANNYTIRL